MLVYRVEDEHGCGPYNLEAVCPEWDEDYCTYGITAELILFRDELCERSKVLSAHPLPHEDGIPVPPTSSLGGRRWDYLFGFASLDQARDWFGPLLDGVTIPDVGFRVSVYEVDETFVHMGTRQVAFHPDYARLINTLPIGLLTQARVKL